MICNECETVAHCTSHGCIPKQPAQPQEPLGYLYELIVEGQVVNEKFTSVNWDTRCEPFGRNGVDHGGEVTKTPLYTSPPAQRTWAGLTDDEVEAVPLRQPNGYAGFARAIEAKLKEKNT